MPARRQVAQQLHADGVQTGVKLAEAGAVQGCSIGQLLQLHPGRGDARGAMHFDFTARGRAAQSLMAGCVEWQAERQRDLARDRFLAPVLVRVADDATSAGDAVGQDMNVLVGRVGMAGDDILVVGEFHAGQETSTDGPPLAVIERLSGPDRQRNVHGGLADAGPESANRAELPGQLFGVGARHVGVDQAGSRLAQVVVELPQKARALGAP